MKNWDMIFGLYARYIIEKWSYPSNSQLSFALHNQYFIIFNATTRVQNDKFGVKYNFHRNIFYHINIVKKQKQHKCFRNNSDKNRDSFQESAKEKDYNEEVQFCPSTVCSVSLQLKFYVLVHIIHTQLLTKYKNIL